MGTEIQNYVLIIGATFGMVAFAYFILAQRRSERMREMESVRMIERQSRSEAQLHDMIEPIRDLTKHQNALLNSQERLRREFEDKKPAADLAVEAVGFGAGGYIILDLPEAKKALFHDLLKGFEDYARLRGYSISFSVDSSFSNKIAFKFTLDSSGIVVSTQQVRKDLKEYITKVQSGESLDDLPVVLPVEEHNALLVAMKNRINFLQHTYTLQKNVVDFYNTLFKRLPQGFGVAPAQNFYLQAGESIQTSSYHALNSPQTVQGAGNRLIGNELDMGIHVAHSFNERKTQVDALEKLYWALMRDGEKLGETEKVREAEKFVNKAKEELTDEEQPDPNRIHRWLETAKHSLKALALTKEVTDAAKVVWEVFKMSF